MIRRPGLLLPRTAGIALALTLTLTLGLAGCAGVPEIRVPKEVAVSTPVVCVRPEDLPQKLLVWSDDELLALDDYRLAHALWAAVARLRGYAGQLEIIAEGCSRIAAPP